MGLRGVVRISKDVLGAQCRGDVNVMERSRGPGQGNLLSLALA